MVYEKNGDLLDCGADAICHQVNFAGAMGGGVALAIRQHVLMRRDYQQYVDECRAKGADLLGTVLALPGHDKQGNFVTVFNLFSQRANFQTDYTALLDCLTEVEDICARLNKTVALPYGMGCGIATGDWATVRRVIDKVFAHSPVLCTIVRKV